MVIIYFNLVVKISCFYFIFNDHTPKLLINFLVKIVIKNVLNLLQVQDKIDYYFSPKRVLHKQKYVNFYPEHI